MQCYELYGSGIWCIAVSSRGFGTVRDTNCEKETDKCARSVSRANTPCCAVRAFAAILYVSVMQCCAISLDSTNGCNNAPAESRRPSQADF